MSDEETSVPDPILHCSFCAKSQHEVRKLVASLTQVFICDECVGLCNEIFEDEGYALAQRSKAGLVKYIEAKTQAINDLGVRIGIASAALRDMPAKKRKPKG